MTYIQWIVSAVLGVTGFMRVAMTTPEPESKAIQPLGRKMCDRQCSHRVGCSGYLYSPLFLSCQIISGKRRPGQLAAEGANNYKVFKGTQTIHENDNLTCVRNSKIFRTRRRIVKCRYIRIRRSGLETYTRLLLLPSSTVTHEARQFYLGNKSVAMYPNLQVKRVLAVAYVASKRKLLIYSPNLNELYFVSLDDNKKTIISTDRYISDMAVDDEKQLVFLTASSPKGIFVMTTEGTNYRLLKTFKNIVGNIAIDSQKQLIYTVVFRKHILKLTYEGASQEIVVKACSGTVMCLNSKGSVLYYFEGIHECKLFKLSLPKGIPSEIPTTFQPNCHALYVFSNKLYLNPINNRGKLSVLSDSGKQIRLIDAECGSNIQRVVVCAIP